MITVSRVILIQSLKISNLFINLRIQKLQTLERQRAKKYLITYYNDILRLGDVSEWNLTASNVPLYWLLQTNVLLLWNILLDLQQN